MAMAYAGYEVIVYEKIRKFLRLGDSLGVGENALRLLTRWGCRDRLIAIGNKSPIMSIRRWDTGEIIANQRLMDMAGYIGAPLQSLALATFVANVRLATAAGHRGDYRASIQGVFSTFRSAHPLVPQIKPSSTVSRSLAYLSTWAQLSSRSTRTTLRSLWLPARWSMPTWSLAQTASSQCVESWFWAAKTSPSRVDVSGRTTMFCVVADVVPCRRVLPCLHRGIEDPH